MAKRKKKAEQQSLLPEGMPVKGETMEWMTRPRKTFNKMTLMYERKDMKEEHRASYHLTAVKTATPTRNVEHRTIAQLLKLNRKGQEFYYADFLKFRPDLLVWDDDMQAVDIEKSIQKADEVILGIVESLLELGIDAPIFRVVSMDRSPKAPRSSKSEEEKKQEKIDKLLALGLTMREEKLF